MSYLFKFRIKNEILMQWLDCNAETEGFRQIMKFIEVDL